MAGTEMQCSVITPEGKAFEGAATEVVIPAHDGEIGILHDHAPLVCKLGAGSLRVSAEGTTQRWFLEGGFCQVVENRVTILTQHALTPDKIDVESARQELADAKELPTRDEIDARRKAEAEASARAKLRMAKKK